MHSNNALRERFSDGGLSTASGSKVIVLCFERLDRDLAAAIDAISAGDVATAHEQLVHAQDIVHELLFILDLDAWEHAPALASIYRYVLDLLTRANVRKELAAAREARTLLGEIGEAFRVAASQPVTVAAAPAGERQFSARA